MSGRHPHSRRAAPWMLAALAALLTLALGGAAFAQDFPEEPGEEEPPAQLPPQQHGGHARGQSGPAVFPGVLQTLRAPAGPSGPGPAAHGPESSPTRAGCG